MNTRENAADCLLCLVSFKEACRVLHDNVAGPFPEGKMMIDLESVCRINKVIYISILPGNLTMTPREELIPLPIPAFFLDLSDLTDEQKEYFSRNLKDFSGQEFELPVEAEEEFRKTMGRYYMLYPGRGLKKYNLPGNICNFSLAETAAVLLSSEIAKPVVADKRYKDHSLLKFEAIPKPSPVIKRGSPVVILIEDSAVEKAYISDGLNNFAIPWHFVTIKTTVSQEGFENVIEAFSKSKGGDASGLIRKLGRQILPKYSDKQEKQNIAVNS